MSKPLAYKRRTLFIQRAFQGKFILWMLGVIVLFGVCSAFILYLLLASDLESESFSAHVRIADTWQKLGLSIVVGNAVSAVFSGISVVMVVLYLSHKIAGPMYRFQQIFTRIGAGDLEAPTHLRENDQMKELASALDDMLVQLRQQRDRRIGALQDARGTLARIRELSSSAKPEFDELIDRIEANLADALQADTPESR